MIKLNLEKKLPGYCGLCSLKYVMDYYGITKSQKEIAKFAGAAKENGSEPWDLLHAASVFGFSGEYIVECSMDRLKEFISKGTPVIVEYEREFGGHYSVVVGFKEGKIYLADPNISEVISMDEKEFQKIWFDEYTIDGKEVKILREAIVIERKKVRFS